MAAGTLVCFPINKQESSKFAAEGEEGEVSKGVIMTNKRGSRLTKK